MPYLMADDLPRETAGRRFRALLDRPGILQLPGAHNGMAALQAKAAGFDALYLSGAAMTASMGLPDLGIITVDEVAFFIRQIARAAGLPLLVDGDTGYGEALNVMHMVRTFEEAGAGAVHLEDQLLPKKCGHLNDKKLADARDMAAKVAAAAKARRDLVIVARTDAAASEGLDGAIARAKLYIEAGADAIFPEALNVMHMVRTFEEAGAGAVHLEDQLLPKKCGHLNDKKLADARDMAAKVAAAAKARRDLVIVARTDAAASEGLDGAIARAKLYIEAGADAIFPEALTDLAMLRAFAEAMPSVKLLANMTEFGRTPYQTAAEFEALGYAMVIWPVSSLRVANKAQERLYAAIRRDGGPQAMIPEMQTRAELYETIGLADYETLDASIVKTVLPGG